METINTVVDPAADTQPSLPRKPRGFAAVKLKNPNRVKEIARLGGLAAHSAGTAHEWNSEQARSAGKLGGIATARKRKIATA